MKVKNRLFGWLGIVFVVLAAGCGKSGENAPPVEVATLNGVEYGVLQDGGLSRNVNEVRGSGSLIFKNRIPHEEANNFALKFTLEDGGALSVVPFAKTGLTGDVQLVFSRSGDELKITLKDGAKAPASLEQDFLNTLSAKGVIELDFDVHAHDAGDGHLIIWAGGEEQPFAFSSDLSGRFWGLILEKAGVTHAVAQDAKDQH